MSTRAKVLGLPDEYEVEVVRNWLGQPAAVIWLGDEWVAEGTTIAEAVEAAKARKDL